MAGSGVDVADFVLVDSSADGRVQVADLVAGIGRVAAEHIAVGNEHPVMSSVGSFQSLFAVRDHMHPEKARSRDSM